MYIITIYFIDKIVNCLKATLLNALVNKIISINIKYFKILNIKIII